MQMFWGAAVERAGVLYDEASSGVRDGSRPTESPDRMDRAAELEREARAHWMDAEAKDHFLRSREIWSGEPESDGGPRAHHGPARRDGGEHRLWARASSTRIRASQRLVMIQLEDEGLSAEDETRLFENQRSNREFEVKTRLHIAFLLEELGRFNEAVSEFDEILIALQPDLPRPTA